MSLTTYHAYKMTDWTYIYAVNMVDVGAVAAADVAEWRCSYEFKVGMKV